MVRNILATGALALLATGVSAQSGPVEVTSQAERWYYPFDTSSPASSRSTAALFTFTNEPEPEPQFDFDYRDGTSIQRFVLGDFPAGVNSSNYVIDSATLTVWALPNQNWPNNTVFELFAAGFGPTYDEATWNINDPFVGGVFPPQVPRNSRDPFARNLADNSPADNQPVGATPWAIGVYNAGEVLPTNPNPIQITFNLDLNNPTIESELRNDIAAGRSIWVVASDFAGAQQVSGAPSIYHTPFGSIPAPATPPRLEIVVSTPSSVSEWMMMH